MKYFDFDYGYHKCPQTSPMVLFKCSLKMESEKGLKHYTCSIVVWNSKELEHLFQHFATNYRKLGLGL